jgi:LSD1 subclass zinc finger protein
MSMVQLMYLVENPGQILPEDLPEDVHRNLQRYNPDDIRVNPAMQEAVECGVCYESKSRVKLNCSHEFCKECVHLLCLHQGVNSVKCPMCRANVTTFDVEDEASREALLIVA